MTDKIKAQSDNPIAPRSHDDAVMEVLSRLDALRGIAAETGDQLLAEGLSDVFDSFLARYCDSRHAALGARIHQNYHSAKTVMH
ncbi:hypothetical protein [Asticcacaulis sp. 201]|uniref:hypothetical protein n=1 Tax=Asticcacaulis sp. 201 TaxID=3028787 RepID=UPI0029166FFA|nr:hypothetical protein [Asticcacaulis sp. 201]MDV6332663.1 hypothetical protein [Asticcacaulis sp. 201]